MRSLGYLLIVVLLAGCSSAPERKPGEESRTGSSSVVASHTLVENLPLVAEPGWTSDLKALQNPVPAGDVLIAVVAARGDELDIVALDRATGQVRWRRPFMVVGSQVGAYLGDLVYESAAGEQFVVFQSAETGPALTPGDARPYLAVEPATGKVVARTGPVVTKFGAPACPDGTDVCLRISEETFTETRWVLGTWRLRPERDPVPGGAHALTAGSDVYTVHGPVDGYAVARAMGRVGDSSWRVPHRRITGGRDWLLDDDGGLVDETSGVAVVQAAWVGSDAQVKRYEAGGTARLDMAKRRTVGVDTQDGRVLWRHDGADFECLELTRYELPVRCAFEGWRMHRKDWDEPRLRSARAHLEGYDPTTGETTWRQRLDAHAVRILLLRSRELDIAIDRIADGQELAVVSGTSGEVLLSLVDGSTREIAAGEALLCSAKVPYRHRFDDLEAPGVVGFGDRRARHVREPCTSNGRRTREPLGASGLLTGAVEAGEGIWVFAGVDGLRAYELS